MSKPVLIHFSKNLPFDVETVFIIWLLEQDEETKLRFKNVLDLDLKVLNIIKTFMETKNLNENNLNNALKSKGEKSN